MTDRPKGKYGGLRKTRPEAPTPAPQEPVISSLPEEQISRKKEPVISEKPEKPVKFGTLLMPETVKGLRVYAAQNGMHDWQVVEAALSAFLKERGG